MAPHPDLLKIYGKDRYDMLQEVANEEYNNANDLLEKPF